MKQRYTTLEISLRPRPRSTDYENAFDVHIDTSMCTMASLPVNDCLHVHQDTLVEVLQTHGSIIELGLGLISKVVYIKTLLNSE